jgi:hypothetical protein
VKFKIIGGSQVGGPPLCKTCKNVTIVKGQNCQELMAWKIEARKRGPSGFGADAVKEGEMEVVVTPPKKRDSDYE